MAGIELFGPEIFGHDRAAAKQRIIDNHYTHSVPAGKSHYYLIDEAIVVFSLPANNNIGRWLLGDIGAPSNVWELSRLWAPDGRPRVGGHANPLLTRAISESTRSLRIAETPKVCEKCAPKWCDKCVERRTTERRGTMFQVCVHHPCAHQIQALVSYADPNTDRAHNGLIYRAACWAYLGQVEDGRYYRHTATGQVVARRKFHSGGKKSTGNENSEEVRYFPKKAEILEMGYSELKLPGKHRFAKGLTLKAKRIIEHKAEVVLSGNTRRQPPPKRGSDSPPPLYI
jgi:hypothetical protein